MHNRLKDFKICIKRDKSKRPPCYRDRPVARKKYASDVNTQYYLHVTISIYKHFEKQCNNFFTVIFKLINQNKCIDKRIVPLMGVIGAQCTVYSVGVPYRNQQNYFRLEKVLSTHRVVYLRTTRPSLYLSIGWTVSIQNKRHNK